MYNNNGLEVKSFLFNYYYTTSADSIALTGINQYAGKARKRLMLSSVTEHHLESGLSLPPYEFTYNFTPLPSRLSASQDLLGVL